MATCPTCRTRYPDDVTNCAEDGSPLLPDAAVGSGDPELAPGIKVGEYCIEGKIGEGGFGTVYRAVHPVIGKAAAIKVLSRQYSSNPHFVSRFIAEARAVNQIRHRNIIDIFSFGALEDGRQYYVMELLEGMPLDAYLKKRGRIPISEALPILLKVARALDAAHAAGIAHRDLKPENVFLVFDEDNAVFPKLLDFGIAKLLGESSSTLHKTRTGLAMGTPLYMSPEQCRGKNVDHRTDIYSFGILVHELLTGEPPFNSDDPLDILFQQTSTAAPTLSSVNAELPPALDAPLLRMLEKEAANRPASLTEAMAALIEASRGAGHDVPAIAHRTGDELKTKGGVRVIENNGKGSARSEALANTQLVTSGLAKSGSNQTETTMQTSLARQLQSKSAPGLRRTLLLVGAALVGGAAVAVIALGFGDRSRNSPAPSPSAGLPPVAAALVPAPGVLPSAAAASAVTPAAAPLDEIELTIEATPKDAEIWRDGKLIGNAPGKLRLPRDHAVSLTFKAPGYQAQTQDVPVSASSSIVVTLKKAAANRTGTRKKGDLENPFQ